MDDENWSEVSDWSKTQEEMELYKAKKKLEAIQAAFDKERAHRKRKRNLQKAARKRNRGVNRG